MDMNKLLENYGCLTFSDDIMRERIPKSTYKAFHERKGYRVFMEAEAEGKLQDIHISMASSRAFLSFGLSGLFCHIPFIFHF